MTTAQQFQAIVDAKLRSVWRTDWPDAGEAGPSYSDGYVQVVGGPLDGLLLYVRIDNTDGETPTPEHVRIRTAWDNEISEVNPGAATESRFEPLPPKPMKGSTMTDQEIRNAEAEFMDIAERLGKLCDKLPSVVEPSVFSPTNRCRLKFVQAVMQFACAYLTTLAHEMKFPDTVNWSELPVVQFRCER